jgi:hypothetical protein
MASSCPACQEVQLYGSILLWKWYAHLCAGKVTPTDHSIGEDIRALVPELHNGAGRFDLVRFRTKVREQREIVSAQYDVRVLKEAIGKFTSLQHVQLLRVQDEEDTALLAYARQHDNAPSPVPLEWATACSHGSQTIGAALLASDVPWSRFSSPMLSPQSVQFLNGHRPSELATLAERLTCLTLHFDDGTDLDIKMGELSGLFRAVFTFAKHMQAVHVGFPSHRPLSLPLEEVFHNVTWEKLVAFGVQGWKLSAEEILGLALRHRDRLKGLRLRDVLLRDGSKWKDVLSELRASMHRLNWVSLRRIGYARHFDDLWLSAGAEVPDDPPPGESESESGDDDFDPLVGPSNSQAHTVNQQANNDDDMDVESGPESDSDSDDEHGADAHDMDFPPLDSPTTPASATWCNCNGRRYADSPDNLGDNGIWVSSSQRKGWEKWVVRRCPEHGER